MQKSRHRPPVVLHPSQQQAKPRTPSFYPATRKQSNDSVGEASFLASPYAAVPDHIIACYVGYSSIGNTGSRTGQINSGQDGSNGGSNNGNYGQNGQTCRDDLVDTQPDGVMYTQDNITRSVPMESECLTTQNFEGGDTRPTNSTPATSDPTPSALPDTYSHVIDEPGLHYQNEDLRRLNIPSGPILTKCHVTDCNGRNITLRGCTITRSSFSDSVATDCAFRSCNLWACIVRFGSYKNTDFLLEGRLWVRARSLVMGFV